MLINNSTCLRNICLLENQGIKKFLNTNSKSYKYFYKRNIKIINQDI